MAAFKKLPFDCFTI